MKIIFIYSRFFVSFIIFHKCLCKDVVLEMELEEKYNHEAYVAGIGSLSVFNETKLSAKKKQTFTFSTKSAAGNLIGYQLRLPTAYRLSIVEFTRTPIVYLFSSVIRGPITVLMHPGSEVAIFSRYLFIGAGKVLPSEKSEV